MELAPKILMYVSYFSVLIPICFLLVKNQNLKIPLIKVLLILLIASVLSDLLGYILIKSGRSNIVIDNSYTFVEFTLLSLIYKELLLTYEKMIYLFMVVFIGFFLIDSLMIENLTKFQNYPLLLEGFILILFSCFYLRCFILNPKNNPIFDNMGYFWLNAAIFCYFGLNIFLFASTNYIFKNEAADIAMSAWSAHNFLNVLKNILFATGIYYAGRKVAA